LRCVGRRSRGSGLDVNDLLELDQDLSALLRQEFHNAGIAEQLGEVAVDEDQSR
jgi:hypothetical protein